MAAADVVIKCEEFMENEVHPEDGNTYFNIYESRDDTEHENDENRRDDDENYENDDIKMKELLREFDLEILFTILKFGDITYRSLKYISENDINAAIRSIAYRAEFREKLFAWRRDKYGLNDFSVLPPPKRPSTLMPLGVNNSNNIQTHNINTNNTNAPSRVTASSPFDHMTTTTTNTKQQPTGKAPRTRRLSTPKTNSAKKPRITNQVQEKQDVRPLNSSPPPRSPTPTTSQPMTSPTPTLSDTMSLLQQETSRIDSHPSMDYDDPLCYQPTTSSAAAAAIQPTGSMKSETSATPNVQPKMAFEKLTTTNSLNCASVIKWLEDHSKNMSCSCFTMSTFAKEHVHSSKNKSATSTIHSFDDIKTADILNKIDLGKKLLETYKKSQLLQPADRTMLVHKIIDFYIEHNIKLSVPKVKYLSEQIIELFPTENQSTYFTGRGKLPPKGKLWDRYQSQIRNLKKLSTFKGTLKQRGKELLTGKRGRKMKEICSSTNKLTEEEQASLFLTLNQSRQWEEILDIWKQTVQYRRNNIDNRCESNLVQILKNWPLYKLINGPELVDIDFNCLITEKDMFLQKWHNFLNVAPALFQIRIKDLAAKQNLAEYLERESYLTTDTIAFQSMHLLHAVLKPSSTFVENKRKKYSISDSQAAFTVFIRQGRELEDVLAAMRKICLQNETCLPPTIVVVGDHFNVTQFYVALDDVHYEFYSYLDALEYCFKLYYIMNLPYPKECSLVWTFVQEYLFGIKRGELEVYPTLETFIGDINSLQYQPDPLSGKHILCRAKNLKICN